MAYYEPINMRNVRFAIELLKNPIFERTPMNHAQRNDKNYIIKGVEVSGYSVKDVREDGEYKDKGAVFFRIDKGLVQLSKSYYPCLRFSIPKSQLVKYETDELYIEQDIEITNWAYHNCYMLPVNKLYEDWGRMMKALIGAYNTKAWDFAPMYTSNSYRELIEGLYKQQIRDDIKNYKKKGGNIIKNGNNNNRLVNNKRTQEPFRAEAEFVFYTDGSGNWAGGKKHKAKGHFSVYLKNTQEKWKHSEDKLTSNQAELLGVMSAISIAQKKGCKKVKIYTDSKNVVNWVTRKKDDSDWFWEARHPNIVPLVERLRVMLKMIPSLKIEWVKRERNFAHGI